MKLTKKSIVSKEGLTVTVGYYLYPSQETPRIGSGLFPDWNLTWY